MRSKKAELEDVGFQSLFILFVLLPTDVTGMCPFFQRVPTPRAATL